MTPIEWPTQFFREVPLTIGTQTKDSIFEVMKEGDMDMLDNVWKQVRNNRSLSKLRGEIGFRKAMTQVAEVIGEEPPEFEDHMPFSNRGIKDLYTTIQYQGPSRHPAERDHSGWNGCRQ